MTSSSEQADVRARISNFQTNCTCATEQLFSLRWDELNRLVEGRRFDRVGGSVGSGTGAWTYAARMRYRYDGANQRTVKESFEATGINTASRVALFIYPGDFERRGLVRNTTTYDAVTTGVDATETQYMVAGARIVWDPATSATSPNFDRNRRITYALTDLLQTSSAVVDLVSGELLELSTYYPNGARENLWASDSNAPLEPMGFTGKEADEEIGLTYFGERWLMPRLGRWASPDPLHVHASGGGEALNSYHYVSGNLLQARDPLGLVFGDGREWIDVPELVLGTIASREIAQDYMERYGGLSPGRPGAIASGGSGTSVVSAGIFTNYFAIRSMLRTMDLVGSEQGLAGDSGADGMPDIVDFTRGQVAEIKPAHLLTTGVREVNAYIATLNRNLPDGVGGFVGLTNYSGQSFFLNRLVRLSWDTVTPGVITYQWSINQNGVYVTVDMASLAGITRGLWSDANRRGRRSDQQAGEVYARAQGAQAELVGEHPGLAAAPIAVPVLAAVTALVAQGLAAVGVVETAITGLAGAAGAVAAGQTGSSEAAAEPPSTSEGPSESTPESTEEQ